MRAMLLKFAAAAAALVSASSAKADCYAPSWSRFSDPTLGVASAVSTDVHVSYSIDGMNLVHTSVDERARPGTAVDGRCSSFNFSTVALGDLEIPDKNGFLEALASDMLDPGSINNFKVVKNRALTFQGYPAREIIFSFNIDFFYTPASHRYLLVARDDRYHIFGWVWGDAEGPPADSQRIWDSIRFLDPVADPHARSRALLEETILLYWLREDYPEKVRLAPNLKKIADPKRKAESAMIKAYGYVQKVDFLRVENGYRVFRVEHNDALVDWYIADDGKSISGLTWKKVRDL